MSKKNKTTIQSLKSTKRIHNVLFYGKFAMPLIPATVVTAVNWDEWFSKQGVGLPFGFATLLGSILLTIYQFISKKNEKEEKYSMFYQIAFTLAMWGVSFLLLSNILQKMGFMFLFVVIGLFASGVLDDIDNKKVLNRINEYEGYVKEYDLDEKKRKAKAEKEERRAKAQAEHEAILKAEQESATE